MNLTLPDSTDPKAVRLLRRTADSRALIGFSPHPDITLMLDAIRAGFHEVLSAIPPSAELLKLSIQCALIRATRQQMPVELPLSVGSELTPSIPLSKLTHDLNNNLTSINGFADILLARVSVADPSHYCAEQIKQACTKADVLVKQFLSSPVTSASSPPSDPTDTASAT